MGDTAESEAGNAETAPEAVGMLTKMARWQQLAGLAGVPWLPVSQPLILYPARVTAAATSAILVLEGRPSIPRELKFGALVYAASVAVHGVWSLLVSNPGAVRQRTLWECSSHGRFRSS